MQTEPSNKDVRISLRDFVHYQLGVIRPYRYVYLGVTILMVFTAVAGYILPAVERRLINLLAGKPDPHSVWILFVVAAVLLVFVRFEGVLQMLLVNSTVQKVMYTMRARITKKLLDFPVGLLNQLGGGYLAGRLNSDLHQVQIFFSNTFFATLLSVLKMLGGIVILFFINWKVAVFTLVAFPLYLLLLLKFRNKHYHLVKQAVEAHARNQRSVTNSLSNINSVKSHGAEDRIWSKLKNGFARETVLRLQTIRTANAFSFLANLIPMICEGMLLAYGIYSILEKRLDLGTLWALNRYMMSVFSPLRQFCSAYLAYQTSLASVTRLIELERNTAEPNLDGGLTEVALKGNLELRDISFSYHTGKDILKQCSLRIQSGQHIVILGESGAGKSTLFALLLGFYRPAQGEILFDGIPLPEYNLRALRKRIGYIGAIGDFLHGTLRENLLMGNPLKTDDAAIMEALDDAGIANLVAKLPEGLSTKLDEARTNFSFGEQLRFALARELLRGCDMLLLDEATANLDHAHEDKFLETIFRVFENKTVIMIRHTPHPMTDVLPHYLLSDGKLTSTSAASVRC